MFSTRELAYHMTMLDWSLFKCVHEVRPESPQEWKIKEIEIRFLICSIKNIV
jgi:hypothetical protein